MLVHHASAMSEAAADEPEYTIDELAASSGVPSRTIRFYQSKGVLSAPKIRGRVAYYGDRHVTRLALIARLQDRGLRMDAIREVVTRIDRGEIDVGSWLGLSDQLGAAWAEDVPRTMTERELRELSGSDRPGLIADLVRIGVAERTGDVYFVRSPALLGFAMRLEGAGIDLGAARKAQDIVRKHLAKAARELADHFVGEVGKPDSDFDLAKGIEALRGTGLEAVRHIFAQEIEKVLREMVTSGKTTRIAKKPKPK